ncbi:MAG: chloride channel protein, partial [Kingella sp. (in: b-proteobacteria)]
MMKLDFSPRLVLALFLTGILAGIVGIVLTHSLHIVQQLFFAGNLKSEHVSFLQLVHEAAPLRRLLVLLLCGLVVGIAWTALQCYGMPLLEIKDAIKQPEKNMPVKTTVTHAFLQILTVGMGSPLGREVAPREMSVALATPLAGCLWPAGHRHRRSLHPRPDRGGNDRRLDGAGHRCGRRRHA